MCKYVSKRSRDALGTKDAVGISVIMWRDAVVAVVGAPVSYVGCDTVYSPRPLMADSSFMQISHGPTAVWSSASRWPSCSAALPGARLFFAIVLWPVDMVSCVRWAT